MKCGASDDEKSFGANKMSNSMRKVKEIIWRNVELRKTVLKTCSWNGIGSKPFILNVRLYLANKTVRNVKFLQNQIIQCT